MAGDHDLVRRIQIGGADHFALRGFGEHRIELALGQFQDRGHRAHALRDGLLHVRPRLRTRRTASAKRRLPAATSAEYSPRLWPATKSGASPASRSTSKAAIGDGEQRGLGVFGQLELILGAFKAEAGDGEAERLVGLLKDAPRGGVGLGEGLAHAWGLRALARKEKSGFGCQRRL